ncbi:MAG: hypothetical protein ACAH83_03630 [Alphaproteobacteria bacterium]
MTEKSLKGSTNATTVMVPILWDSPGHYIPVKDASVETALKSYSCSADVLGFQFHEAIRYRLVTEDSDEIRFWKLRERNEKYLFATKVLDREEVADLRAGKGALKDAFNRLPAQQRDNPANIFYDSQIGLQVLKAECRWNTILINKKGQQLFPPPKA